MRVRCNGRLKSATMLRCNLAPNVVCATGACGFALGSLHVLMIPNSAK
jgi:hypothetical protein